jgi:Sulfotransferase family
MIFLQRRGMATPNFLIIGAARSGTTALSHFLSQHPEVFFCSPKEPHFLALANQKLDFKGPGDDDLINNRAIVSTDKYFQLFEKSGAAKAIGEGSVSSLYYYQSAIANIQQYVPQAKMIVVLRNPIDRAYSSFMYMTARGYEPLTDFGKALDEEEARIAQGWHHIWHYTRMGFYHDQLRAFFDAFGRERVRVYLFDRMHAEKAKTLEDIYDYLGIDKSFQAETDSEINKSGKPKSKLIQSMIKSIGSVSWLREGIKSLVPLTIRDKIRSANLRDEKMPAEIRERLTKIYSNEIERVSNLLNINLSHWLQQNRSGIVD